MLPHTHVAFRCADAALQRLYDEAVRKCRSNLNRFGEDIVLVEGGGYEKIWLETQPMGGEMYAPYNLQAALNNHLLFMRHQRADGRIAGSIQGFPDGAVEAQFNKFQGFCFPWPALNMYYWLGEDRDYLDRLANCLERFDAYLWRVRDSNGDGLLESWCKYDTGEDNAVRYGAAPNYALGEEPPRDCDVAPMASMDVTSFSYACRDTLCEISRIRGDGREGEWCEKAEAVARVLREKLWDAERGALFDRDKHGNKVDVLCHNTLRCMYWGSVSQEMADRFVQEHLLNPEEFWTQLPLPSVAANDPAFRNAPENNWSGQCEGLTYQRAILALERYGYDKLVPVLGKKLMQAVIDGGYLFTQQYDPFTGKPSIVDPETKEPLPEVGQSPRQALCLGKDETEVGQSPTSGSDCLHNAPRNPRQALCLGRSETEVGQSPTSGSDCLHNVPRSPRQALCLGRAETEVGQSPTSGSDCLHNAPRSPRQALCLGRAEIQDAYGPTLLSVLTYIAHIWGVTMVRGNIWFSLGSGMACEYELGWGEHTYRIESDGEKARMLVDGKEIAVSRCGVRFITDQAGNVLRRVEIE